MNMLTLFSAADISAIRSHIDSITTLLDKAQTVEFQADSKPATKQLRVSDTPKPESQRKTRKSHSTGKRGVSVLSAKKVAEIKRRLLTGTSASALAREYKVHLTTINCIKWGKTWKEVKPAEVKPALEIVEIIK